MISCINTSVSSGQSYYTLSDVFSIAYCLFSRTDMYLGSGGVLYCVSSDKKAFIYGCSFNNCTSSLYGGAIYFEVTTNGSFEVDKVCAYLCGATQMSNFGSIKTSHDGNNTVKLLSMSKCYNVAGSATNSLTLYYGKSSFVNTNSSHNSAYQIPGIGIESPRNMQASYNTLKSNYASYSRCIYISNGIAGDGTQKIFSKTNIVDNNSPSTLGVIYNGIGTLYFKECIFFSNQNTLFSTYNTQSTLYVSDSYISHIGVMITGNVNTVSANSYLITPTFQLDHFEYGNCLADIPIVLPFASTIHERMAIQKWTITFMLIV